GAGTFTRQYRASMQDVVKKRAAKSADLQLLDLTAQSDDRILGSIMEKLTEMSNVEAEKSSAAIARLIDTGRQGLLAAALTAMLVALVTAVLLARSIVRPLSESVRVADRVAAGDLSATVSIVGKDETGHLM